MTDRPRQFDLRMLFGATAACAAIFAAFRWLGLAPRTSLFIAAILGVAVVGAISLVVAIGRSAKETEGKSSEGEDV